MIQIFHNARCSKSRAALLLAEQAAAPAHTLLREDDARQLCPAVLLQRENTTAVLQAIAQESRLLQRPIVVRKGRAAIGRPTEAILPLFD